MPPWPRVMQALAVGAVVVALVVWRFMSSNSGEQDALAALAAPLGPVTSTERAQRNEVALPDGSAARLGPQSTLAVSTNFTSEARALAISGPVSLSLKTDESRPVAIATCPHRWVTTGALVAFDREEDRTVLAVDSGSVSLVHEGEHSAVAAGSAVSVDASGEIAPLDSASRERLFGWRNGRLRLQQASLLTLRDELLEWFDLELTFEQPRSPSELVSVNLPLASPDSIVPVLEAAWDTPVERAGRVLRVGVATPAAPVARGRRANSGRPRSGGELPKMPAIPNIP
jgi:ferric-dicitrate binding protein FerR (iron transport regulator)